MNREDEIISGFEHQNPGLKFRYVVRLNGTIEWVCEHGVGHPIYWEVEGGGIHGCDGCCKNIVIPHHRGMD